MKPRLSLLFVALAAVALVAGCANFVKDSRKTLYAASQLADGAMKTYAVEWKAATNRVAALPPEQQATNLAALQLQRSNVMVLSIKVGASLGVADQALENFAGNLGTNTAPKAVVTALLGTAIQQAGNLASEIRLLTGNPVAGQ
jgi:hypothetical protein